MTRLVWMWAMVAAGLMATLALAPAVTAREFRGSLTAPSGGAPFGGEEVGSFEIEVRRNRITIEAEVDLDAPDGYTFEGWLVDMQTGYKLSLGQLDGDELRFRQRMVNPFTYGVLVITMEPVGDLDPNPAAPVAGALLESPFGQ